MIMRRYYLDLIVSDDPEPEMEAYYNQIRKERFWTWKGAKRTVEFYVDLIGLPVVIIIRKWGEP